MNRQTIMLAALGVVLVLVLFYVFGLRPQQNEIAEVNDEIATVQQEQQTVRSAIARLQDVRGQAPAIEADIAAAEAVIPTDSALPSAVRQLQMAADASGGSLETITMSRPARLDDVDNPDLAALEVGLSFSGGYFQSVDFLRRLEDPALSPRALLWNSLTVDEDDYPTLTVDLTGRMFALLPGGDEGEVAPAPAPTEGATDGASEGEQPADGASPAPGGATETPDLPAAPSDAEVN